MGYAEDILELGLPGDFLPEDLPSEITVINPPAHLTPWPAKLPLELALNNEPLADTLARLNVTPENYARFCDMPAFRRALSDAAANLRDNGLQFTTICQGIAMEALPFFDQMLQNPDLPPTLRVTMMDKVVTWGKLLPKEEKASAGDNQNTVNIQFNFSGSPT